MNYIITYADSADRYSARHFQSKATAEQLAAKIKRIQDRGDIIVSLKQEGM